MIIPAVWMLFLEKGNTFKKDRAILPQELKDVRINTETPEGGLWSLKAERATIDRKDIAMLYNLRFISEKKGIELTAPYGRYELNKDKAEITGGVLIKLSDGSEARISSLNIERGVIKSDQPVVIKKGNMILKGKGLISEPERGELRILRDVRVEIR